MKKVIIVIIISFLFIQNGFSQKSNEMESRFIIKIMPLSIFDAAPRLRFGLEYVTDKRFAYSIDLGIGNSAINSMNIWRIGGFKWSKDYAFYEIRPEIKFIFLNEKPGYLYAAVEIFYMKMQDYFVDSHYEKENSNIETTYDSALFHKQKYGLHLKAGMNLIAYKRFNFDLFGGLGFAIRTFEYTDVVNPVDGADNIFTEWGNSGFLFEGTTVVPHLALGFKIGYTL